MEKIGVEAVVAGLSSFLGDMKKVDSSITSLIPGSDLLSKAFTGIGSVVEWLTGSVFRVLEYTLGNLISSAIQAVVSEVKELISGTVEAGMEFQTLELRLRNFNLNSLVESGMSYNDATKESIRLTEEQLTWLQKLAATTPYDLTDISNVYTLARSYGFASESAQTLTKSITSFAAGMGLGNTEIERIIVNFGQMEQQGKVTQRELNDLARGAFVPVNDILKIMQEQTGLTGKAFDDFRNSGEGVQAFMDAFISLTGERFTGSTEAMARTWEGATSNVKDFLKSIVGLDVVKPVLDKLGGYVADFLGVFTRVPDETARAVERMGNQSVKDPFESIVKSAKSIGTSLTEIIEGIVGLGPSAETFAQKVVDGFDGIARWLKDHKEDIVDWVKGAIKSVQDFSKKISTWIQNVIVPAFDKITGWISEHRDQIERFFSSLGEIVSEVFTSLFGGVETGGADFLDSLLSGLSSFMEFVINNKDAIADWIVIIIKVIAVFTVLSTVFNVIAGIIVWVIGVVIGLVTAWISIQTILTFVLPLFGALGSVIVAVGTFIAGLGAPILILGALIVGLAALIIFNWDAIKTATYQLWVIIKYYAEQIFKSVSTTFQQLAFIVTFYAQQAWTNVETWFTKIVSTGDEKTAALSTAVLTGLGSLLAGVISKMISIYNSILNAFNNIKAAIAGMSWVEIGVNIILGIISGVQSMVGELVGAVTDAASAAVTAAQSALAIKSPSKVFFDIGKNVVLGMVQGIASNMKMITGAMQSVSAQIIMPAAAASRAAPSQVVSNITNAQQYNLNINTSASTEPIISDFNMMSSLP